MTRKGKSNTNKVLATTTHVYAKEHGLLIGQLIFDPAGEYANVNKQDKTALAEIGPEHVVRYQLGATDEESTISAISRHRCIEVSDEDSISVVWNVVGNFVNVRTARSTSRALRPRSSKDRPIHRPATTGGKSPTLAAHVWSPMPAF